MPFHLSLTSAETLPPLAWVMNLNRDSRKASVITGTAVESDNVGIIAGAWSGPFAGGGMADAVTSVGSGLQIHGDSLIVICGTAGADMTFVHRLADRLTIGNSLPLVLAVADDRPRCAYAFYSNDLFSIHLGAARYRKTLPMMRGSVSVNFGSFELSEGFKARTRTLPRAPRFSDFAEYRSFLVRETASVFVNASDPARKVRYQPIAAVSAGYDSPAAAVIARDAGCRDCFTFRQSVTSTGEYDDSGEAVALELGLSATAFDTFAYRTRTDCPEIAFASAGFGGGDTHLAGHEDTFRERIVVGGGGGDRIWDAHFRMSGAQHLPTYLGGYTATKYFLELPALMLAVPAIGVTSFEDIGRISRSAEMRPWFLGSEYNRPIARRIVEEAGVSRGSFARRKRRISSTYEEPRRKISPLATYFSSRSMADFEHWFSQTRRTTSPQIALHNLAQTTIGRLVWSKKLARWLGALCVHWPPAPGGLWHLRMPIRRSAFVFQWAVEREIEKYQTALADARDRAQPASVDH